MWYRIPFFKILIDVIQLAHLVNRQTVLHHMRSSLLKDKKDLMVVHEWASTEKEIRQIVVKSSYCSQSSIGLHYLKRSNETEYRVVQRKVFT